MNSRISAALFLILVFSLIITSACDDTINQDDQDALDNKVIPNSGVSYSEHIQPIFNYRCNNAGCHNDTDHAGNLTLTSHSNTTQSYLVVAPGSPDNSSLVWSVEGNSAYPMPPVGYRPLTSNQIKGIRTWVKEGAKNN